MAHDKLVSGDATKFVRKSALAAAVLAAVSCSPAWAVGVFDFTTNQTLFFDNFESGNFASPAVGSWSLVGLDVNVTNASSPAAAQGTFYASLFRNSDAFSQGNLRGALSSTPNSGDVIGFRMMVYIPSASDADSRGQFILDTTDFTNAVAWARPDGAGHVDAVTLGTVVVNTGLTYKTDTWQEWDLSYSIGALTFGVCVDGTCASGFSSIAPGTFNQLDLFNGNRNEGSLFLDAVPSSATPLPAAFPLLASGLGALGLLGWRRKKKAAALTV